MTEHVRQALTDLQTLREVIDRERLPYQTELERIGEVLLPLLEGEATAELAPEPEPQPHTAAEVWRGLSDATLSKLTEYAPALAEALDREAGR